MNSPAHRRISPFLPGEPFFDLVGSFRARCDSSSSWSGPEVCATKQAARSVLYHNHERFHKKRRSWCVSVAKLPQRPRTHTHACCLSAILARPYN
jgi:hypothetical protein